MRGPFDFFLGSERAEVCSQGREPLAQKTSSVFVCSSFSNSGFAGIGERRAKRVFAIGSQDVALCLLISALRADGDIKTVRPSKNYEAYSQQQSDRLHDN